MKSFSANTNIKAAPDVIWCIITDATHYPEWDPSAVRVEGTIADGQMITAYTKLSPRAFPAKVTNFQPNKSMQWVGGMPLGLFKGVRTFTLHPKKDGSVDFSIHEEFSGIMLFLMGWTISRMLPDLTKPFQDLAAGLKARAEASTR